MRLLVFVKLILVGLLWANAAKAQTDTLPTQNDSIQPFVEVMPEFPGGMNAMITYLSKTIVYPKFERFNGITGKVILTFIVEKDGSISTIEVIKPATDGLNQESIRVLKGMPHWKPGYSNGEPVRVKMTLPIKFDLEDPKPLTPKQKRRNDIILTVLGTAVGITSSLLLGQWVKSWF